jgi:hypothetical protein
MYERDIAHAGREIARSHARHFRRLRRTEILVSLFAK